MNTWLIGRLGILLGLILLIPQAPLYAQEQLAKVPYQLRDDLMGRSSKELSILLGPPDKKRAEEAKSEEETWLFGSSKVFLEKGVVIAFVDEGDLMSRRSARPGAERKIRKIRNYRRHGWVNAWTHKGGTSEKDVIDSIISD